MIMSFLLIGMTISCSKDELLLLENIPMFANDGAPRQLARPESVQAVGDFNYKIKVVWPEVSASITSADILIEKEDFTENVTITDFTNDFIFEADELTEYSFKITYNAKNNSKSNSTILRAIPRDFEINYIMEDLVVTPLSGEIQFAFTKYLLGNYKYHITYEYNGQDISKEFTSSSDTTDAILLTDLLDDLYDYDFKVQITDVDNDITTDVKSIKVKPLPMPHIIVSRNLGVMAAFDGAAIRWGNPTGHPVKINVSYEVNGEIFRRTKESTLATDSLQIFGLPSTTQFEIFTEGAGGDKSEIKEFHVTPNPLILFNNASAKSGWIATVSSNQSNDGGGAPALIDGNNGTFWHTPWSSPVPYPHHATIELPTTHMITKVGFVTRNHSTPNSPGEIEVQYSSNGIDFITHESFVNTVNGSSQVVYFTLSKPLMTRYVRLLCKTSLSNTSYMNLAEINLEGFVGL